MVEHHDNAHSLTTFIGVGVALGVGVGAALGVALGNVALGVGIGPAVGIGLAIGIWCIRQTPIDRDDAGD